MPRIIGGAGLVVAVLATLSAFRDLRNRPSEKSTALKESHTVDENEGQSADDTLTSAELRRLGAAVAAVAALALLTPILGFAISALLSGTALAVVAGQRVWWKALATGAATAVGVSVLFVTILDVPLPAGVLG
jgi:cell division protein FtsW (lipid II flippase)